MRMLSRCACLLVALGTAATARAQICDPHWSDAFEVGDFDDIVRVAIEWDEDGAGPLPAALYVGGDFEIAGGVPARHLAKWDGVSWSEVGGGAGVNAVLALLVWDDDGDGPNAEALYVGTSDGVTDSPFSGVSRWDGSNWSALGGGIHWDPIDGSDVFVRAMIAFDEDGDGPEPEKLVVGGRFDFADGIVAEGLARWDGSQWEAMGEFQDIANTFNFLNTGVQKLLFVDTDGSGPLPTRLCAIGGVDNDGSEPFQSVVAWNGTQWEPAYRGIDGILTAAVFDVDGPGPLQETLIIGGVWGSHVSRWNGSGWEALGPGLDGNVRDLEVVPSADGSGTRLVASGAFSERIVEWDGANWVSIAPTANASVFDMLWTDNGQTLTACGQFSGVGAVAANRVARFSDGAWSPVGSDDPGEGFHVVRPTLLRSLPCDDGYPALYVGGDFGLLGTEPLRFAARWDGQSWYELADGRLTSVTDYERFDDDGDGPLLPKLYAAGSFTVAGGAPGDRITRWDGLTWSALPTSPSATINALQRFDPDAGGPLPTLLIVGGTFTTVGGASMLRIAAWNGATWQALGTGTSASVSLLEVYDADGEGPALPLLIVGGTFATAGGVTVNGLATWNGSAWSTLPDHGFSSTTSLLSFDPDQAGPQPPTLLVRGVAVSSGLTELRSWDGSAWTTITVPEVSTLTIHDWATHDPDGPGPRAPLLCFAGYISYDGEEYHDGVFYLDPEEARIDAVALVDEGGDRRVYDVASFDPDGDGPVGAYLCVAGAFRVIGGQSAERFAVLLPPDLDCACPNPKLGCTQSDCYPIDAGDCVVNLNDLGVVLSSYAPGVAGQTRADGDIYPAPLGDGFVDLRDLGAILSDFGTDCR